MRGLLALSLVVALALCSHAFANLLRNGGFEAPGARQGEIPGWSLNNEARDQKIWVDSAAPLAGKGALAIRSTVSTKGPTVVSQRVKVEPNSSYALTLWARRDSFVHGTTFEVELLKGGKRVGVQRKSFRGSTWFPVAMAFDTGSADTAEVRIVTPNKGTGRITVGRTLWVDNVNLARVDIRENLLLDAGAAGELRGCESADGALRVAGVGQAGFRLNAAPAQSGPYYLWMRAKCPGENAFSVTTPSGRTWEFRSHTPSSEWRWTRPVLPEFLLEKGRAALDFSASGRGVAIDEFVLTMDPFWRPENAPKLMKAADAIAERRKTGFSPKAFGAVDLSVLPRKAEGLEEPKTWFVSNGVPFPMGALGDPRQTRLMCGGVEVPRQAVALTRWPDGSVKWMLVSALLPRKTCRLEYGTKVKSTALADGVKVRRDAAGITVDTGAMRLRLNGNGSPLFGEIAVDRIDGDGRAIYERIVEKGYLRANGTFTSQDDRPDIAIVENGPVRASVRIKGKLTRGGEKLLDYVLRVTAYAGARWIEIEPMIVRRDGPLKVDLNDAALVFDTAPGAAPRAVKWQDDDDAKEFPLGAATARLVSRVATNPEKGNDYPFAFTVGDKQVAAGERCPGALTVSTGSGDLTMAVRHFWQNSPKRYVVSPKSFEVQLVGGDSVTFWRGMAKTHTVLLGFCGGAEEARKRLALDPILLAKPEWYAATEAFDARPGVRMAGGAEREYPIYERCVDATLDTWMERIEQCLFRVGCGGMIHAGDFGEPAWFGNLESALGEGFMVQFLRSGERRIYDQADLSLRHFSDIDIDHSDSAGGLIYVHAKHGREVRNPVEEGVNGHSWFNGTSYYGLFTGARRILEQADAVGQRYAQHTFPPRTYIHYWRRPAWKLMALMDAYDLTGKTEHLEAARREAELTDLQKDHVITLWPYMAGVGLKALRRYATVTEDPEARETYLQTMDGFLHLRARPNDTVNGEHRKLPGMLFGNFPNDRSCAFYNELAQAYFMTGDARYARLAAADLDWQTSFAVNDPTLLWGSSDLIAAMRELEIEGPEIAATLPMVFMPGDDAGQPGAGDAERAAVTFQVVEKEDQAFSVHLFKGCYRKYTDPYRGEVVLYGPDGRSIDRKPVSCEGLQRFALRAPKDGKTGVYTLQVRLEDIWRWTADDVTFELGPGDHRMQVASRYDCEWVDKLVLTPNMDEFPWLGDDLSPEAIVFEAEEGTGEGFEIGRHAGASNGKYAKRTGTGGDARQTFAFRLPAGPPRRYRLFARVWKPRADLLNVWMDDAELVMLKQTHDMDGNTYPIWSAATTLGEEAVVPYWRMGKPGRPGAYITDNLKAVRLRTKAR